MVSWFKREIGGRGGQTGRQTDRRTERQKKGQTDGRKDRETEGRTDRRKDRKTDGRTDRQTDTSRDVSEISLLFLPSNYGRLQIKDKTKDNGNEKEEINKRDKKEGVKNEGKNVAIKD